MCERGRVLEAVINVSEGRDAEVIAALSAAAGDHLLDVHSDTHHHRTVLTLAGPDVERRALAVVDVAIARIDLRAHAGVHPRLGAVDVVPFVPLAGSTIDEAVLCRDRFAAAIAARGVPVFSYGPERSLPDVRRRAFVSLRPDLGPPAPHPTAGAVCVGARPVLVAYNVWLAPPATVADARRIARSVRSNAVRTLGLDVGGRAQVSCNLIDPGVVGPDAVVDGVAALAPVAGTELVGLVPAAVLDAIDPARWASLDLDPTKTIEARLGEAGLDGGRFGGAGQTGP